MDSSEPKKSKAGLIISLILAIAVVAGAVAWAMNSSREQAATTQQPAISDTANEDDDSGGSNKSISLAELAAANGKDGNECYVAVEGTVYEIKDSSLWQNGQHTPSNGQGYCGADMTEAISRAPHGKSKLEQLNEVGRLEQ